MSKKNYYNGDFERSERVKSVLRRMARPVTVFVLSVTIVVAVVLSAWTLLDEKFLKPVDVNDTTTIVINIERGSSVSTIAKLLEENNVIRSASIFKLYIDMNDKASKLKYGIYEFDKSMTLEKITEILTSGSTSLNYIEVLLKEGQTVKDLAEELLKKNLITDKDAFLESMRTGEKYLYNTFVADSLKKYENGQSKRLFNMEGYLFPDTYNVTKNSSEQQIINMFLDRLNRIITDEFINRANELGMTMDEVITLASMIQKEAKPNDMAKVSAVFHLRLKENMTLGSDPTIGYVLGKSKYGFSESERNTDSPYNTYKYHGLPEGPICNPGKQAIEAALWPDEEFMKDGYYYFLTKNPATGELAFSKTYQEHFAKIELYRPIWDEYNNKQGN